MHAHTHAYARSHTEQAAGKRYGSLSVSKAGRCVGVLFETAGTFKRNEAQPAVISNTAVCVVCVVCVGVAARRPGVLGSKGKKKKKKRPALICGACLRGFSFRSVGLCAAPSCLRFVGAGQSETDVFRLDAR